MVASSRATYYYNYVSMNVQSTLSSKKQVRKWAIVTKLLRETYY